MSDAATRRGVHDRLANLPPVGPDTFRPGRTLALRVELVRQVRRRRTQLSALLLIVLPVIIAIALKVNNPGGSGGTSGGSGGAAGGNGGSGSALIDLGSAGAANFAFYCEFASAAFLLVVIVALFCGDTVASEASWSSLRYLLAIPVPRARLLRQKLTIALALSLGANLLIPVWSFLVGGVFFGWASAQSPLGGTFSAGEGVWRLLIVVGYASLQSLLVAALAFLLSVLTDAPLGAVGGSVLLVVVSNILDAITALGSYRNYLPTHYQYSWLDALGTSVNWDDMIRGTGVALTYSAVFLAIAWWRFGRKDIVS